MAEANRSTVVSCIEILKLAKETQENIDAFRGALRNAIVNGNPGTKLDLEMVQDLVKLMPIDVRVMAEEILTERRQARADKTAATTS